MGEEARRRVRERVEDLGFRLGREREGRKWRRRSRKRRRSKRRRRREMRSIPLSPCMGYRRQSASVSPPMGFRRGSQPGKALQVPSPELRRNFLSCERVDDIRMSRFLN